MALTTTTLSGAVAAGTGAGLVNTTLTLAAHTTPSGIPPQKEWLIVDAEIMLVTDTTLSPTLAVVRGYAGTQALAHSNLAAVQYGLASDFSAYQGQQTPGPGAYYLAGKTTAQEVTATGATGSTAAAITGYSAGFLNCTGTSGAGINLPVPQVGDEWAINNKTTGALNVYSVGATINGTTGTTAYAITATATSRRGPSAPPRAPGRSSATHNRRSGGGLARR